MFILTIVQQYVFGLNLITRLLHLISETEVITSLHTAMIHRFNVPLHLVNYNPLPLCLCCLDAAAGSNHNSLLPLIFDQGRWCMLCIINIFTASIYLWCKHTKGLFVTCTNSLTIVNKNRICDWACENRAYLHTNFGLIFEFWFTITFKEYSR